MKKLPIVATAAASLLVAGLFVKATFFNANLTDSTVLLKEDSQECGVADVQVDGLTIKTESVSSRVIGRLVNHCDGPVAPEIKFIFYGQNDKILKVEDVWPASTENVPPKSDWPFDFRVLKVDDFARVEARVVKVKPW